MVSYTRVLELLLKFAQSLSNAYYFKQLRSKEFFYIRMYIRRVDKSWTVALYKVVPYTGR
jgi:hypothetical protein